MNDIIPGRRPVMEALTAGTRIEKIVLLAGVQGKAIEDIKALARDHDVPVVQATRQEFRNLATDATTQGVVAIISARTYVTLEDLLEIPAARQEQGVLLILDEIEDPHNLGALIRTAECSGVHGVVIPRHHAASVTAAVVKASAGATEHIPVAEVTNIVRTLEQMKEAGYWVAGLDATAEKLYTEVDYTVPTGIVVGNEGRGMRRLVREHCDQLVKIPLYGVVSSLNASVAGALAMYEVRRQRTASGTFRG